MEPKVVLGKLDLLQSPALLENDQQIPAAYFYR
jgi:hypothetical protein